MRLKSEIKGFLKIKCMQEFNLHSIDERKREMRLVNQNMIVSIIYESSLIKHVLIWERRGLNWRFLSKWLHGSELEEINVNVTRNETLS